MDLTGVMFITTANTTDTIPRPLLDRMEVIQLTSYTDEEKVQIARRHLLPKQMREHGLKKSALRLSDDVLRAMIRDYTRESGVRLLERRLAAVCRKADMRLLQGDMKRVNVTEAELPKFLDCQPYPPALHTDREEIGVVNGLAWTESGGEILEVEVNVMEGSGKLELTGNLGDVMKESAQAALSCLRSRAAALGWIQGYSDDSFRPDQYISRAQAVTMINRVLCRLPEDTDDLLSGMNTWTDCHESDWFYLAIQEATNSHDFVTKDRVYESWTDLNRAPDWSRYE
mgnify:CR=1 FL=1